jgi:hypothetical protein
MKRLFNNKYESFTKEAQKIADEVSSVINPIINKYNNIYYIRDIESVISSEISVLCSTKILLNAIKMKKNKDKYKNA